MQVTESAGVQHMGWHFLLAVDVAQVLSCDYQGRLQTVLKLLDCKDFVTECGEGSLAAVKDGQALCIVVLGMVLQIPDSDLLDLALPKVKEVNGIGPRAALLLPPRHPFVFRSHHCPAAASEVTQPNSARIHGIEACRSAMRNYILQVSCLPPSSLLLLSLSRFSDPLTENDPDLSGLYR